MPHKAAGSPKKKCDIKLRQTVADSILQDILSQIFDVI